MYPMKKCSVTPRLAAAMLERQAGRPLSASELYTGNVSPHGTYNYGTALQAPAVYSMRHRYGFNVAGRGDTHFGGFIGSAFSQAAIWAVVGALLMPLIFNYLRRRGGRPLMRQNPIFVGAITGVGIGVVNTLLAQYVHRPLVQAAPPQQSQQKKQTQQQQG